MESLEPFLSIGVAFIAGLLVGFEREQAAPEPKEGTGGSPVGGTRTFPLVAVTAALSMLLSRQLGYLVVAAAFVSVMLFVTIAYVDDVRRGRDRGITSEVAFPVTFLLGAISTSQGIIEPSGHRAIFILAAAVLVTLLLSVKPRLHAIAARTSKEDLFATLKFLTVAVVVLPLLPNQAYGPLAVLNPFKIGLMVVLIAGIDFVGYVAIRLMGPGRGLGLTGLLGGLASSTAVTLSMSRRARAEPSLAPSCSLAVVTASSVMFPRVLIEVAIIHRPLLTHLWLPLGAMAVAGMVSAGLFYRRARRHAVDQELELTNPFELGSALKWGLVYALVLFASKLAHLHLGSQGAYLAGLLAGATDVDAITLSTASLARDGLASTVAATTIVIGAASNTLVKGVMANVVGGWRYGRYVLASFGAMVLAGGMALIAVWLG